MTLLGDFLHRESLHGAWFLCYDHIRLFKGVLLPPLLPYNIALLFLFYNKILSLWYMEWSLWESLSFQAILSKNSY